MVNLSILLLVTIAFVSNAQLAINSPVFDYRVSSISNNILVNTGSTGSEYDINLDDFITDNLISLNKQTICSLCFDGTAISDEEQCLRVDFDITANNIPSLTIEVSIYQLDTISDSGLIISNSNPGTNNGRGIFLTNPNFAAPGFEVGIAQTVNHEYAGHKPLFNREWSHIIAVWDSATHTAIVYKNDEQPITRVWDPATSGGISDYFCLNTMLNSWDWKGCIGLTRIYDSAASNEDILKLKQQFSERIWCDDSEHVGAQVHEFNFEYDNAGISNDCSFDIDTSSQSDSISLHDGIAAGVGISSALFTFGSLAFPVAGTVLGGLLTVGDAIFNLINPPPDNTELIFEAMSEYMEQLWQCTQDYVDAAINGLRDEIFEQGTVDGINDAISEIMDKIRDLSFKNTENRWLAFVGDGGNIFDDVDDLIKRYPNSRSIPNQCRSLIPLIINGMNINFLTYGIYLNLAFEMGLINHPWNLTKAEEFRRDNVKLMKLYLTCAPHAYFDMITSSTSFPLSITQIEAEIDTLFSSTMFCSWVQITHDNTFKLVGFEQRIFSYDFDDDIDFTIFENCGQQILTDTIMQQFEAIYQNDKPYDVIDYKIASLYPNTFVGLVGSQTTFLDNVAGSTFRRCPDTSALQCTSSGFNQITFDDDANIEYYSFQVGRQSTLKRVLFGEVCSDRHCKPDFVQTVQMNCGPARKRTGIRYLIADEQGSLPGVYIMSVEFLCTNHNDYDGFHTTLMDRNDPADSLGSNPSLHWSPWFVCPKGTSLQFFSITGVNECVEKDEFATSAFTALCLTRFRWENEDDIGMNFFCTPDGVNILQALINRIIQQVLRGIN